MGAGQNEDDGLQDRGKPAVKPDQKQSIEVGQMSSAADLAPQHHHLMPKRGILGFKSAVRLERRDQQIEEEEEQRHHHTDGYAILSPDQYG